MKLAVPFNHDPCLLDELEHFRRDIGEVYLPPPPDLMGTFRPWTGPDADEYNGRIPGIVTKARDMGIETNIVMNVPYIPFSEHGKILGFLARMVDIGVQWFTIGDLHLAEAVREAFPDIGIVASTIADVSDVTRARYWARQAGADRLVLSRLLNKRPDSIREISRTGAQVEVIVNESCIPSCPYATQHCSALGGWKTTDEDEANRFQPICRAIRAKYTWEHFKTEILPFSVPRLEGVVDFLKLAGRDWPTEQILNEVRRFTQLESDRNSQLGCYREPDDVWDMVASCDFFCEDCGFCEEAFHKANPDFERTVRDWLSKFSPPDAESRASDVSGVGKSDIDLKALMEDLQSKVLEPAGLTEGGRIGEYVVERLEHGGNGVRLELGKGRRVMTLFVAPYSESGSAFVQTERWNIGYLTGKIDDDARTVLKLVASRLESSTPPGTDSNQIEKWFPVQRQNE